MRLLIISLLALSPLAHADPQTTSWLTTYATKYARIYTNDANKLAGTSVTTWTNGTQTQSTAAYCGVQYVAYSTSWTYIRTSGLAAHIMGPWLNGAFPNLPKNQKVLYRFPRTPSVPGTKTATALGVIGYFVDGVGMFDSSDGFKWTGSAEASTGTGYWNRDAYVNEGATFDPGYAHQEGSGTHHYHANPIALRYLLGDHVDFNSTTKAYSESAAAVTKHSPILGWVRDGYPVYGPYGYSSALDAGSGVRRMVSGYLLRDGTNGTDNLTATGRTTIPAWAVRVYGVSASQSGPTVNGTYPLGRYMEDKLYRGDLGQTQGVTFDLDEYNGRFCVTPEYPGGTYAYFVAIDAGGAPTYPYNIGRAFYGSPTGSTTTISETVTTVFTGESVKQEVAHSTDVNTTNGNVTVTWSSTEGGTYKVEASSDLSGTWSTLTTTQAAAIGAANTSYTESAAALANPAGRFYKITRNALATYDAVIPASGGSTVNIPGGSAAQGTTITALITLPSTPPRPPAANVPTSITLAGSILGTSISRPDVATAQCTFVIPAGAPTGTQNVVVTFNPAPTYSTGLTLTITAAAAPEVNLLTTATTAAKRKAQRAALLKRKKK